MRIIKHCHEEGDGTIEVAQGALLGMVVDNALEITNCFAFPKNYDDDEEYQLDMMRNLKLVNVDHYHVGWYQSSEIGSFLSLSLLESQFHYQTSIEESVVLIYDNAKTDRGFLSLKAYRMTPQAIELYKQGEFTTEAIKTHKVGYENLLVEIPLRIRNSTLTNILLSDLGVLIPPQEGHKFLDLGTANVVENQLRSLMDCVDDLNQETMKFNRHQQAVARQMQEKNKYLQKVTAENAVRAAKGEPPLPEEDLNKLFKPLPTPPRLLPMTLAGKVEAYSKNLTEFSMQSLAKLYLMEALHTKKT
ncbi:unnamed protein product [Bemisia tabaci]|nr:unnamed protein product [Bemisia tabaci]